MKRQAAIIDAESNRSIRAALSLGTTGPKKIMITRRKATQVANAMLPGNIPCAAPTPSDPTPGRRIQRVSAEIPRAKWARARNRTFVDRIANLLHYNVDRPVNLQDR